MSVMLTATRRATQRKALAAAAAAAKLKKKSNAAAAAQASRGPASSVPSVPPMSNQTTTVWFWQLDGIPTTVMFNQDKCEVWCNGYMLDTVEETFVAGSLTFGVYIRETDTIHQGKIMRFSDGMKYRYQLFVNDCTIPEHTNAAQEPFPEFNEEAYQDELLSYYADYQDFQDLPPSYEDALLHPLTDCCIDENKKVK